MLSLWPILFVYLLGQVYKVWMFIAHECYKLAFDLTFPCQFAMNKSTTSIYFQSQSRLVRKISRPRRFWVEREKPKWFESLCLGIRRTAYSREAILSHPPRTASMPKLKSKTGCIRLSKLFLGRFPGNGDSGYYIFIPLVLSFFSSLLLLSSPSCLSFLWTSEDWKSSD